MHHHARKNVMRFILLTLLLLAASPDVLCALPGESGSRDRSELRQQIARLNLTPEQKSAMRDIRTTARKNMIDLRADLQKKRIDAREIMQAEAEDRHAFERIAREIADLQVRQKLLLFDTRQEIMKLLTPEQQQQFRESEGKRRHTRSENVRDRFRGRRD